MNTSLPISRLVNVAVNLTPAGAQSQSLSALLILGNSDVIDTTERIREYSSLDGVVADFGTTAPEYKAAALWFEQVPQPIVLKIGRWAKTATKGRLVGKTLSAAQQSMSLWNAITTGAFTYTRDGGAPTNVTGLNFSAAANLNAVASIITAALTGATMVWNATYQRFELTSSATGASSSITFLSTPPSGTDISDDLGMRSTDSGAYRADGMAAETAVDAVAEFDLKFGQSWYALVIPEGVNNDHLAVAAFIEGTNTKHLYGVTTQEAGALSSVSTTDLAYLLKAAGYNKTMIQYSSSNAYAVASALARILTTDYGGNNTMITLMYKQEPGIVAENLNANQVDVLQDKHCNVFVAYNNDTAILQHGVCCSGNFVDIVTGTDWLAVTIQTRLYNILYTSPTKIPQTDAGMHVLLTAVEAVCSQGVTNGLLAPGVWNSNGFGTLRQGDYLAKGFYVYAPRVDTQDPAQRAARHAVPIQVAAKLAGAIHDISVSVAVNQ